MLQNPIPNKMLKVGVDAGAFQCLLESRKRSAKIIAVLINAYFKQPNEILFPVAQKHFEFPRLNLPGRFESFTREVLFLMSSRHENASSLVETSVNLNATVLPRSQTVHERLNNLRHGTFDLAAHLVVKLAFGVSEERSSRHNLAAQARIRVQETLVRLLDAINHFVEEGAAVSRVSRTKKRSQLGVPLCKQPRIARGIGNVNETLERNFCLRWLNEFLRRRMRKRPSLLRRRAAM
jgi:hypothetical protein